MAKENDAYAICTAQKKKSGMGHDAWKRCVDKVKKEESTMNFNKRVISIFEKRKIKEKMGNQEGGTNATVTQGPEDESDDEAEAELDAEDTLGEKKGWIKKAADSIEDRGTEGKCTPITKPGCTGRAKALAKTFKKIGKERDAKIVSKKEKAAKKKK